MGSDWSVPDKTDGLIKQRDSLFQTHEAIDSPEFDEGAGGYKKYQ